LFTLNTTVFISPDPGADITTFLAPALICFSAFSLETSFFSVPLIDFKIAVNELISFVL